MDDKNELIACIETGNFAKAARIAAGEFAHVEVPGAVECAACGCGWVCSISAHSD